MVWNEKAGHLSLIKDKKEFTTEHFFSLGMLLLLFAYMFALNFLMPLHRDDFWYSLIWGTFDKIRTWPDIFQSLFTHYYTHGGRMVSFLVLDSFLLIGKGWFNLLNAFLFVALIVLIYWHSQREANWRFNPCILLLIMVFTWLGLPHFGEVVTWMTGACVYLLTAVLILAFLLPYHLAVLQKPLWRDSYLSAAGMLVGGVIAGWTVENTAATMVFMVFAASFYAYKKQLLTKWMVAGNCGALIGFAMLVIAPGNYVRAAESKTKLLYHFTNQFAAGGELLLYVLPVVLFLIMARRILLKDYAVRTGVTTVATDNGRFHFSSWLMVGFILLMIYSYMNGTFLSYWFGSLLYDNVVDRLGVANDHTRRLFFNMMSGLEEMMVYLLTIAQIYRYSFRKTGLRKKDIKALGVVLNWRRLIARYPNWFFVLLWIAIAGLNHLVMLASPRFPGRATFGSAVFLIIAAASVFTVPEIYTYLLNTARKKCMAIFCTIVLLPMATAVLYQEVVLYREDGRRMVYVEQMVAQNAKRVAIEPISFKNRMLRHIYFEDLTNDGTRAFLRNYYGLEYITLTRNP